MPNLTRRQLWGGILALGVIAALLSRGFAHADEHFQIFEFAALKLGLTRPEWLAVEYHEALRPWLQPAVLTAVARVLQAWGVSSPFHWALTFRGISAALGLASVLALVALGRAESIDAAAADRVERQILGFAAFAWFLPALHARPSSEAWGGALLLLSLAALAPTRNRTDPMKPRRLWGAGLLSGLAFDCRYQLAACAFGIALSLLRGTEATRTPRKNRLASTARFAGGFLGAALLGVLLDRWGYGRWTLAPWNYFRFNLIQNRVSDMGVVPWWDYFRRAITEAWPLLGLLGLVGALLGLALKPRTRVSWAYIPFIALHFAIGHKELRFLYPLALAGPLLWTRVCENARRMLGSARGAWIPALTLGGLLLMDLPGLALLTAAPAWPPIRVLEQIWDRSTKEKIPVYFSGEGPYRLYGNEIRFYRPPELAGRAVTQAEDLPARGRFLWYQAEPEWSAPIAPSRCVLDRPSIPTAGVSLLSRWNPRLARRPNPRVYLCESSN